MQNFASIFMSSIRIIINKIENINVIKYIFPPTCTICGKLNENYICDKCSKRIKKYEKFRFIENKTILGRYLNCGKVYFDKFFYCYEYKGLIRKSILKYKFSNKAYFCNYFAKMLLNCKKTYGFFKFYDIIISVPMERKKELERGYNQAKLITDIISKNTNISDESKIIKKIRKTKTQSTLNLIERKENIKNAFALYNKKVVKGKRIILLDDICTTGNTVNEISRILKEAEAKEILVLVIAKD